MLLAVFFNLDAIASIGSAVALLIFTFITAAHFRVRAETGANAVVLSLAIASAGVVLLTFVFTTLIHEPASLITLAGHPPAEHRSGLRLEADRKPAGPGLRRQRSRRVRGRLASGSASPGDLR